MITSPLLLALIFIVCLCYSDLNHCCGDAAPLNDNINISRIEEIVQTKPTKKELHAANNKVEKDRTMDIHRPFWTAKIFRTLKLLELLVKAKRK